MFPGKTVESIPSALSNCFSGETLQNQLDAATAVVTSKIGGSKKQPKKKYHKNIKPTTLSSRVTISESGCVLDWSPAFDLCLPYTFYCIDAIYKKLCGDVFSTFCKRTWFFSTSGLSCVTVEDVSNAELSNCLSQSSSSAVLQRLNRFECLYFIAVIYFG